VSHYEERLERDLDKIRGRVNKIGRAVVAAVESSVRAALTRSSSLATETILGDMPINRQARKLDQRCHRFIATHLPSAGHLRLVSAGLRLSKTLERIGDYAETIARAAVQLSEVPPGEVAKDIEFMGRHATNTLETALKAFEAGDAELARSTRESVVHHGATFDKVFADIVKVGEKRSVPVADLFSLMAIFNRLERILHQSKNICEQTLFAVVGETKEEKTFDVLFVDSRNAGASLLAELYCQRAYPESGTFESAGWDADEQVDQRFVEFGVEKGLDLMGQTPRAFGGIKDQMADYDLIIDLVGGVREHLTRIPFHSTLIHWPLEDRDDPALVYAQLVPKLRDLMALIRGEEDD
jgi:phosphate transport system protein